MASRVRREQPKKDNRSKRVNYDNMSEKEFDKDFKRKRGSSRKDGSTDKPKGEASNAVRWYSQNDELLKAAGSISYGNVTGEILPFGNQAVPGVMSILYRPSLTSGWNQNDACNRASNDIFSFTVHANSRNTKYDAPDEFFQIVAGASAFACLALGIRAYGVTRSYNQRNTYTPEALLIAMGFDPDDMRANLANVWFDLNEMIARVNQIWIPNSLSFIERWFWMNTNIYKDGDSVKDQYYMYVPTGFLKLSETGSPLGTSLTEVLWMTPDYTVQRSNTHKWSEFVTIFDGLMESLIMSQDRGIIFGDILKAYGAENLYRINPITSDYTVEPVYDREVLTQMENCYTTNFDVSGYTQNDKGQILPTLNYNTQDDTRSGWNMCPSVQVLNFHQNSYPTPEQIMVATRMKPAGQVIYSVTTGSDKTWALVPQYHGTEVPIIATMYCYQQASDGSISLESYNLKSWWPGNTLPVAYLKNWAAFDWSMWLYTGGSNPTIPANQPNGAYSEQVFTAAVGDYANYTTVDRDQLRKLHTTAVYSEFGVKAGSVART